jgi:hypothetical protein
MTKDRGKIHLAMPIKSSVAIKSAEIRTVRKESLNSDGNRIQQYQQNLSSIIISLAIYFSHRTRFKKGKLIICIIYFYRLSYNWYLTLQPTLLPLYFGDQ